MSEANAQVREGRLADDWRPGWAKRASSFEEVRDMALAWQWSGESADRVKDAVKRGARDLTKGARELLWHLAYHLNDKRLPSGDAWVWPSAQLLADLCECTLDHIRGLKRELEHKGYILRDYTAANRPPVRGAIDLRPTVARLAELQAAAEDIYDRNRERVAGYMEPQVYEEREISAHPEIDPRLEQSQTERVSVSPVPRAAFASRRSAVASPSVAGRTPGARPMALPDRTAGRTASARGSPARASGGLGAHSGAPPPAEMLRRELRLAQDACPRISALVESHLWHDPASATRMDRLRFVAAARDLLPDKARNNDETAGWAWDNHGPRAIVMLAIALEASWVRDPCPYFGWMAKGTSGVQDLQLNLKRILREKGEAGEAPPAAPSTAQTPATMPPTEFADGFDPRIWEAIREQLRLRFKPERFERLFGPRTRFHCLVDQQLHLFTANRTDAMKIKSELGSAIRQAAREAGFMVLIVVAKVGAPRRGPGREQEEQDHG